MPLLSATILMATYNGEKFLAEQLDSVAAQTFTNWRLMVSDDGSTDGTLSILKKYQALWGKDKLVLTLRANSSSKSFFTKSRSISKLCKSWPSP